MNSEDSLIQRIVRAMPPSRAAGRRKPSVRLGMGDDASVISGGGADWVLSCDAFLEGIHFLSETYPADSVGYKSLVRAASDLVAMGSNPRLFLLTLVLPQAKSGRWLDAFLAGLRRAAGLLGMQLIGGDTTRGSSIAISLTVLGELPQGLAVSRSGAHPGDLLCVSGPLGQAQLGLELMRIGKLGRNRQWLEPHLYPRIPVELGVWLAANQVASAMMDLSDGLSTDLARLCRSSGVGAQILADRIPCVQIPSSVARQLPGRKLDALQMALHGGEDYGLVFTIPQPKAPLLRRTARFSAHIIGEITSKKQIVLIDGDGHRTRLPDRGWNPFRKNKTDQ